nr:VCBS repeat-containing protein [Candidatus Dojkabacteria bacterium]
MKINWGKTLSTFLLCTFLFNTVSPPIVFAQEVTQSVNSTLEPVIDATENISPKTDTPKNISTEAPVTKQPATKEKDTTKEVTPQAALPATESTASTTQLAATASTATEGPGPGEIKSPDNPLNTNASYQTSLLTGSATYEYSIPVPPGTNGLTPEVKLSYNSMGASGKEGMLGMGWSLNNSYVYRDPNYSVNDVSNDIYKLVLNGTSYDLVYDISTQLYRTEIESNIWIKYYLTDGGNQLGSYWEVKTKEGTSYKFGNSLDSESVCLNRNYVTRWHLKTVTDINSNNIYFTYLENLSINDIGTTYLSRISYNNDLSRSIEFIYNDKQYSVLSFEQGCSLRESKYLKEIQTKIGNTLNKKFEIEYDLNNPRLLLLSLQEKDGAGVGLPKIKFEYYKGNIGSFTSSPNFSSSTQTYFMDFDRDGLPERFLNVTNRSQYQENDGNMILPTILSMDSKLQYGKFIDNDYQFLDFNADGFVDYINSYFYPPDAGYKRDWFFYSGDGKGQFSHVYTIPKSQAITASSYKGVRIVDLNGDSFPDIVYQEKSFVNVGSNWIQKTEWNIPRFYDSRNNIISSQHYLHDINGDGFVDFVDAGESIDIGGIRYSAVYLNTGSHFLTTKTQFNIYEPRFAQPASILVDIDNDGLIDILQSYDSTNGNERIPWIVYKNNGKGGWQTPETWIAPTTYSLAKFTSLNDINGDGLLDLANYSYGDALLNTSEPRINMLKKITNTLGGITEIEYTPSTKFDNTGGDGVSDLGFPVYAVTKITENDGVGATTNATTYAYKNGLYDYQDREFRGFGQVTSTNSEGTVTEHYFKQDDALKGNEYKTIVKDTSNKPYQETQNTWSSVLNAGVYTNRLITSDSFSYDGISSNPKQTKVTYEYDPYGNVTKEKIWGDISVTGDEMTTTTAYVYNPAKWILSKPKNTFVTNWLNTKVREGWFYYDNSIDNNALPVKGLL